MSLDGGVGRNLEDDERLTMEETVIIRGAASGSVHWERTNEWVASTTPWVVWRPLCYPWPHRSSAGGGKSPTPP